MVLTQCDKDEIRQACAHLLRGKRAQKQLDAMFSPGGFTIGGKRGGTGVVGEWMGRDYTAARRLVKTVMEAGWLVDLDTTGRLGVYRVTDRRLEKWQRWVAVNTPDPRVTCLAIEALEQLGETRLEVLMAARLQVPDADAPYDARQKDRKWWFDPLRIAAARDALHSESSSPSVAGL